MGHYSTATLAARLGTYEKLAKWEEQMKTGICTVGRKTTPPNMAKVIGYPGKQDPAQFFNTNV